MQIFRGADIAPYTLSATRLKPRVQSAELSEFIKQNSEKVCILYGLRRTGKTTLLRQTAASTPADLTAILEITEQDSFIQIAGKIREMYYEGIKFLFIDEITKCADFIDNAAILADSFANLGMHIVCSGTDSLGFYFASLDSLFSRCVLVHTTFISFAEYCYLFGACGIDRFIEVGGTLDSASFSSPELTAGYTMSAIAENIQHSLRSFKHGVSLYGLQQLYHNNELTNVINRIFEDLNHEFSMEVIERVFSSFDLKQTLSNCLKDPKRCTMPILTTDFESVINVYSVGLNLKPYSQLISEITPQILSRLYGYLQTLELVSSYKHVYVESPEDAPAVADRAIITQIGLRYSQVSQLCAALKATLYLTLAQDTETLSSGILEEAKGRILEEWVIFETQRTLNKGELLYQVAFSRGEFDMVVIRPQANEVELYELKHALKQNPRQIKNLINDQLCNWASRLGRITKKIVLYRGETLPPKNGIEYINVMEYLCRLHPEIPITAGQTKYF